MMCIMRICGLAVVLAVPVAALGQLGSTTKHKGVITVEADGVGLSDTEALKDALRNAVRKACGQFLHGETIVRKDQIIRDDVLSISEGIVDDYKELESKREDGLIKKRIRARVQRRVLAGVLLKSSLAGNTFDGKKLFSRLVSRIEADEDARGLFQRLMTDFLANVVSAEIVSEPDMVSRDGSRLMLDYKLAIRVDPSKYEDFVSRLFMVADRAAPKKGSLSSKSIPDALAAPYFFQGFVEKGAKITDVTSSKVRRFAQARSSVPWLTRDYNPRTHMILLVNDSRNESTGETGWRWFHFPLAKSLHHHGKFLTTFSDDTGRTIYKDQFRLGPVLPGFNIFSQPLASPYGNPIGEMTQVIICPYLVSGRYYSPQMTLVRSMSVSLDDLRSIRRTDFKLIADDESPGRSPGAKADVEPASVAPGTQSVPRMDARDFDTSSLYPRGSPRTSYRNSARTGSFGK